MKKFLTGVIILFACFIIAFLIFNNKENENNDLKKVTLADTTLTSRTYMNCFSKYILRLK